MHDPKVGDLVYIPEEGRYLKIYEVDNNYHMRLWCYGGKHDCYYWSPCMCHDCIEQRINERK